MEHLGITDRYTPAQLSAPGSKETVITYYVVDPATGQRKRMREKLNHIRNKAQRIAFAKDRVRELNSKLRLGWNPLLTGETSKSVTLVPDALRAFVTAKEREGLKEDSMRTYRSGCDLFARWVKLVHDAPLAIGGITTDMARRYLEHRYQRDRLSNRTYNGALKFMRTLFNWLQSERYVGSNPFAELPLKKVDRDARAFRKPTEAERALIRADLLKHRPRFFTFCMLCFHMGIRPKEAFMLKPGDIHLAAGAIVVRSEVAKNDRTQGVAIPDEVMPLLHDLQLHAQHPDHYVFSTRFEPGPKLHTSRTSGKEWERMRQRTGLDKRVTMYQIKHSGAIEYARAGLSAVDLMNHLRHADLAMTTVYTEDNSLLGVRSVKGKMVRF